MDTSAAVIVCFGDSITAAGWPAVTQKILEDRGVSARCINAGVRGNTSAQAIRRLDWDVLVREPQIVLIQFGFNDCNRVLNSPRPRVLPTEFRTNIESLIQRIRAAGGAPAVIANHHTLTGRVLSDGRPYETHSQEYAALAAACAHDASSPLLDLRTLFPPHGMALKDALAEDGIHLSPAGIESYAQIAAEFLLRSFEPLLRP